MCRGGEKKVMAESESQSGTKVMEKGSEMKRKGTRTKKPIEALSYTLLSPSRIPPS
jgi:hypothetical protein